MQESHSGRKLTELVPFYPQPSYRTNGCTRSASFLLCIQFSTLSSGEVSTRNYDGVSPTTVNVRGIIPPGTQEGHSQVILDSSKVTIVTIMPMLSFCRELLIVDFKI